jgi:hypothetical protein
MFKRIKGYSLYIRQCFGDARKPAWASTMGFFGTLLTFGVLFILNSVLHLREGEQMPTWLSYVLGVFGVFLILWVVRAFLIGQYELYKSEKSRREAAESKIKILEGRGDIDGVPDAQPLDTAINLISSRSEYGRGKTYPEILDEIIRMAMGGALTIEGRRGWIFLTATKIFDVGYSPIQTGFLCQCTFETWGPEKTPVLVEIRDSRSPIKQRNAYWRPLVSMAQIKYHFRID